MRWKWHAGRMKIRLLFEYYSPDPKTKQLVWVRGIATMTVRLFCHHSHFPGMCPSDMTALWHIGRSLQRNSEGKGSAKFSHGVKETALVYCVATQIRIVTMESGDQAKHITVRIGEAAYMRPERIRTVICTAAGAGRNSHNTDCLRATQIRLWNALFVPRFIKKGSDSHLALRTRQIV